MKPGRKFGHVVTAETRLKISAGKKGFKHSEETKEKMSKSFHAHGFTDTMRVAMKKRVANGFIPPHPGRAENNRRWNGRAPLKEKIRNCFQYRQWRSDVFTRDNFTCQSCGDDRGGNLEADHIKPFSQILNFNEITTFESALKCEELWNINNGKTLCKSCHRKTPTFGGGARRIT